MTNGEFVSSILTDARLNVKDTYVSRRHVLNIAKLISQTYIAQRLDEFKLFREYSLISTVKCFEMEPIDVISCGFVELKSCKNVMRSVNKIPETIKGSTGYAIFSVTNIDDTVEYREITFRDYSQKLKQKYVRDLSRFYYIEDGYIYLPNDTNEVINLSMIVLNEEEAEEKSNCSSCKGTTDSVKCKSLWDEIFICPDKLIGNVRSATLQSILTMVSIPEDSNPNLDVNQRGKTVV